MEYCEHGDLKRYLADFKTLPENQVHEIAPQILGALASMHENGFAHRDLKPAVGSAAYPWCLGVLKVSQNILIKSKPPTNEWWIKLCDFGLSKRQESVIGATTVKGTLGFMPPETIGYPFFGDPKMANPYSADMWCFGETLFQCLTGHATFEDMSELHRYQANAMGFPFQKLQTVNASGPAANFIHSLMLPVPWQRFHIDKAGEHPWLKMDYDPPATLRAPSWSQIRQQEGVAGVANKPSPQPPTPIMENQLTQPSGQWTTTADRPNALGHWDAFTGLLSPEELKLHDGIPTTSVDSLEISNSAGSLQMGRIESKLNKWLRKSKLGMQSSKESTGKEREENRRRTLEESIAQMTRDQQDELGQMFGLEADNAKQKLLHKEINQKREEESRPESEEEELERMIQEMEAAEAKRELESAIYDDRRRAKEEIHRKREEENRARQRYEVDSKLKEAERQAELMEDERVREKERRKATHQDTSAIAQGEKARNEEQPQELGKPVQAPSRSERPSVFHVSMPNTTAPAPSGEQLPSIDNANPSDAIEWLQLTNSRRKKGKRSKKRHTDTQNTALAVAHQHTN